MTLWPDWLWELILWAVIAGGLVWLAYVYVVRLK